MQLKTNSMDKVADYLKELEESHKHKEIFKSMVFPDTRKMRERPDSAVVQAMYTCEEDVCDFSSCLVEIHNNERLLKWRSKSVCETIVQDIADHQDDYLPHRVDGFFVNRMGHELVHLKRRGTDGSSVTGFIEYNDLRKDSMEFYDKKKIEVIDAALRAASNKNPGQCNIF